ncbi:hypothetical protein PG988_006534 [Apiospora saccharicola]
MDLFDGLVQRWRGDAELEPTKRKLDFPHNCYNDLKRLSNPDMEIISKALDGLLEQYDDMEMVRVEKRLDRLVKVWNDARYIMQQYRESKNSMNVLISRNRTRQHWIAILTIIPCTSKAGITARPTLLKRSVENEEYKKMDRGPELNLSSLKRRIDDSEINGNPKRQKPNPPSSERNIGGEEMDKGPEFNLSSLKRRIDDSEINGNPKRQKPNPPSSERNIGGEEMDKGPEFNLSSLKRRIDDLEINGNPKRQKPNPPSSEHNIGNVMNRDSWKRHNPDVKIEDEEMDRDSRKRRRVS